jgi:hypothetical protein
MPKSVLMVAVLVVVGASAFLFGTSFSALVPDAPALVPAGAEREPSQRQSDTEALLRETREANRSLREAVAGLSEELREMRGRVESKPEASSAMVPEKDWTARLRAREPDIVMQSVCLLRERMLTKALHLEDASKGQIGAIRGASPAEEDLIRRSHARDLEMYKADARSTRAAIEELDAVRTLEELAAWRHRHGVEDR